MMERNYVEDADGEAKEEVKKYQEGVYGMHENRQNGGSMDRRNERELVMKSIQRDKELKAERGQQEGHKNSAKPINPYILHELQPYIFVILQKNKISIQNSSQHSTIHAMSKHCAKFQQILSSRFRVHEKFASQWEYRQSPTSHNTFLKIYMKIAFQSKIPFTILQHTSQ